jgi:putative flavoprotein involved in K+ transport
MIGFPGLAFSAVDPDEFVPKEAVADYFVAYAAMIGAPIRCGVEVQSVERLDGRVGFRVATSHGMIEANHVVAATGPFQNPIIPEIVPAAATVLQLHSSDYRNPDQLPTGAVLVVGAGSSGAQIADDLTRSGRRICLSIGPHGRPPRRYRGRDFCWWLGVLGKWDAQTPAQGAQHITIAVSGADGGKTMDFRRLASRGITLVGRTSGYQNGSVTFASDLAANLARGDADYRALLDEADAYIARNGLAFPEEPDAREVYDDPVCGTDPLLTLNLAEADVTAIIWATGFSSDYSWLKVDALDENGRPKHQRGVSSEPGVYFIGLPWQTRRGSSFIWGVWHDAKFLADHIATRRSYLAYRSPAEHASERT